MNNIFSNKVKKSKPKQKKAANKEQINRSKPAVNILMHAKDREHNRPQSSQTIHLKVLE